MCGVMTFNLTMALSRVSFANQSADVKRFL